MQLKDRKVVIVLQRMSEFHKVSYRQFAKDWLDTFPELYNIEDKNDIEGHIKEIYDNIKLPERATIGSACYDFFSPMSFTLEPGESIKIPTGIRCEMYDGWVLMLYPRSGFGFKYGLGLANHTAIIDGDFCESDNEGNIQVKLVNDSCLARTIEISKGTAFCQGVFLPFGITLDDAADGVRYSGFGSTDGR